MKSNLRKDFVVGHGDGVRKFCEVSNFQNKNFNFTYSVFSAVRQVLRDISCVNPSRTPKAFKGKGSALSQRVTSGLHSVSSAGLGAGA